MAEAAERRERLMQQRLAAEESVRRSLGEQLLQVCTTFAFPEMCLSPVTKGGISGARVSPTE